MRKYDDRRITERVDMSDHQAMLDDDYAGGEIFFPNFDFRIRPRPGMLIYFPSGNR